MDNIVSFTGNCSETASRQSNLTHSMEPSSTHCKHFLCLIIKECTGKQTLRKTKQRLCSRSAPYCSMWDGDKICADTLQSKNNAHLPQCHAEKTRTMLLGALFPINVPSYMFLHIARSLPDCCLNWRSLVSQRFCLVRLVGF